MALGHNASRAVLPRWQIHARPANYHPHKPTLVAAQRAVGASRVTATEEFQTRDRDVCPFRHTLLFNVGHLQCCRVVVHH